MQTQTLGLTPALQEAPDRIRAAAEELAATREAHAATERELAHIRTQLTIAITTETVIVDGKAKPAFGNETARSAELDRRMNQNPDAVALTERLRDLSLKLTRHGIDLEYELNRFSALRAITRVLGSGRE